jgi:leader peptidase (prepilin peptidase) / N-methyltransferase
MAALTRSHRDSYDIGRFRAPQRRAVNWPLVASLAAAGLVAGWCLRPVVFRVAVPEGEPRRRDCPACGRPIAGPRFSRPASLGSGRCPACRARIGPPPLTLEVPTAVLLGALAARVHPPLVLAAACWLAGFAVALAWTDIAVQRLPDVLTVPGYAGTTALLLTAAAATGRWGDLLRAAGGGLALAACYLVLAVASRSAVGLGDVKLAASLGTLLAWAGWTALIAGTAAGLLLAAACGLVLLAARRATLRQQIPFGPFMILGAFLALLATAAGS